MKCPSCGLEIPDDSEICPYCTANVKKRVRIKSIYVVALILIIVFPTYAILAYTSSDVQITPIKDLTIDDNYNFIHVRGTVIKYPTVYDSNYGVTQLGFVISDGTGEISVKIYRDQIERVVKEHKIPGIGDVVDVEGTFSYGSRKSVIVNNVEFLHVIKGSFKHISVKMLNDAPPWAFKDGTLVTTDGNITGVREYSFGMISTLDDSVDLVIPHAYTALNVVNIKTLGSGVAEIYGSLKLYRPKQPTSGYLTVNLKDLINNPERYNGTNVHVLWARIISKNEISRVIKVCENSTNITVYSKYGVSYYNVGDNVEIQGKFVRYNGTWEIKVTRKNDFIAEPKWEIIMHPQFSIIHKKDYREGENMSLYSLVKLRGIVADYRVMNSGYLITLWNDNRTYSVYVESQENVHGHVDYGKSVVVMGMVTKYKSGEEIKVRAFTEDSLEVVS